MYNINLIPELFLNKEDCCGCTACYSICPQNAIKMKYDDEGFLYPDIDDGKCIKCKKCVDVCSFKKKLNTKKKTFNENYPEIFALKHKDYNIRINSMSGGAFTAISDEIIKNKGIVYGCVMTDNYEAVHKRATNYKERDNMRGSKYIQSNLKDIFKMIKNDLLDKKQVLFTGTPCQVDALKNYLKYDYDNLWCIDILCYGVPSSLVWKSYLTYLENKYNAKCIPDSIIFRNKKRHGWDNHIETIEMLDDNNKNIEIDSGIFKELFHARYILRPSCYQCPYTSLQRSGDITIADFWGINDILHGVNDNKGISMVLVNNKKGKELFNKSIKNVLYNKIKLGKVLQRPLYKSAEKPKNRFQFWKDFEEKDFSYIIKNYVINKNEHISINKYRQYYYLLNKWIELKQKNVSLVQYFKARNYKNIVIYGMGEIGVHLLEELKETDINIKYTIDQKNNPINLIIDKSINKKIEADIVVVTPIFAYDTIKNEIQNYCDCPIISIEEIIFGFN